MTTNQEGRQAAVRALTGTARTYNEDWEALFDQQSIAAGIFNERLLRWINAQLGTSYPSLPMAQSAYAASLGFVRWSDMNTIGWSPPNLGAALIGWYKADKGVFSDAGITPATNGQAVQQWNDQSSNGNNLSQATAGNRPTFNTNVQNSLPGVSFVSASNQILSGGTVSLGGATLSVFCVVKGNTPAANARLFNFEATGDVSDFGTTTSALMLFYASSTNISSLRNNVTLSNGTITNAAYSELGSIYDGVNNTVYINNTAQTAVANSNTFGATGKFNMGGKVLGGIGSTLDGIILEALITNTAISSADRNNIHNYFSNKWGV